MSTKFINNYNLIKSRQNKINLNERKRQRIIFDYIFEIILG